MSKQLLCTCITLFSTFLWRPLHDYDVKPPNSTFYGGRGHTRTNFPFAIWTWIKPLRIQLKDKSPTFDEFGGSKLMQWSLKRRNFIFLVMFSLPPPSSSLLKVPNFLPTPLSERWNRLCFRRLWVLKSLWRTYYLAFTPRLFMCLQH